MVGSQPPTFKSYEEIIKDKIKLDQLAIMLVRHKQLPHSYIISLIRLLPKLNARSFTKFRDGEMSF